MSRLSVEFTAVALLPVFSVVLSVDVSLAVLIVVLLTVLLIVLLAVLLIVLLAVLLASIGVCSFLGGYSTVLFSLVVFN
jgi:hypothetical protein